MHRDRTHARRADEREMRWQLGRHARVVSFLNFVDALGDTSRELRDHDDAWLHLADGARGIIGVRA